VERHRHDRVGAVEHVACGFAEGVGEEGAD
jgi:hypothetical protein